VRAVLLAASLSLCGCNFDLGDLNPPSAENALDLGTALYPSNSPAAGAVTHLWRAPLTPNTYRVGYALSATESAAIDDAFARWARSTGFRDMGNERYQWRAPPGCATDMRCVYETLAARAAPDLAPLIERFRVRQRQANLSSLDLASLIITFVQNIPYEVPKAEPFGVVPPPLVVAKQRGDCDSKALLGHILLGAFGVDSVLFASDAHHHIMLGIALPANGTKATYAGRSYAMTEMTAKGAPIGHMSSSFKSPNDWRAVPMRDRK
jgi:hypothetical protein